MKWTDDIIINEAQKFDNVSEWMKNSPLSCGAARRRGKDFYEKCTSHMTYQIRKPWSDDEIIEDAKKYEQVSHWKSKSSSYGAAQLRGTDFVKKCTKHMSGIKRWTDEDIIEDAKKYETKIKWIKNSASAYKTAIDRNLLNKCTAHMVSGRIKWPKDEILKEAKKYNFKSDWAKNGSGSYDAARKFGEDFFNKCVEHMSKPIIKLKWTKEKLIEEAKKYKNIKQWQKDGFGYSSAKAFGEDFFNECTKHMAIKRLKWSKEEILNESKKYNFKNDWIKNSGGSYKAAQKFGEAFFNECTKHMDDALITWSDESVLEEAKKYKTRSEWNYNSQSSYNYAQRNGIFLKCIEHMEFFYWDKVMIINFLKQFRMELENLETSSLLIFLANNKLYDKINLEKILKTKAGTEERKKAVEEQKEFFANKEDNEDLESIDNENITEKEIDDVEISVDTDKDDVTINDPVEKLLLLDSNYITMCKDEEIVKFLLATELQAYWRNYLDGNADVSLLISRTGGRNFELVKKMFLDEYYEMQNFKMDDDYCFQHEPYPMQKLIPIRLKKEKYYGNWSGTGAGKTLSAIVASRYINAKTTLVICNNSNAEEWADNIPKYYNNCNVFLKERHIELKDNNYIIFNYESFQNENSEALVNKLLTYDIDFIIIDEIQKVKQRYREASNRKINVNNLIIEAKNKGAYLLAMTATPVINNFTEAKYLIDMITGENHAELKTHLNVPNGLEIHKHIARIGLRHKPNYGIKTKVNFIKMNGEFILEDIKNAMYKNSAEYEKVVLDYKLKLSKDKIKKHTVIYTEYTTDIVDRIARYVSELGFSVGLYTGEDKRGLKPFKSSELDVLIASSAINTGVDGLQDVCNNTIMITIPWTEADKEQYFGRFNRPRKDKNTKPVDIWIPQIIWYDNEGLERSFDIRKWKVIQFKKSMSLLAVDGIAPEYALKQFTEDALLKKATEELDKIIDRIKNEEKEIIERTLLESTLDKDNLDFERIKNEFSELNSKWSTSNSKTTHNRLMNNPDEWYRYHGLYREARKKWAEIPYIEISKKIKARPDWQVADLGCGENLLKKEIDNLVYSFDHIAIDRSVIQADISNVPMEANAVDVVVLSLAMMGKNSKEYLKEAYRILKPYGNIFISEPYKKWENKESVLINILTEVGFKCFPIVNTGKFIYIDGIKP